MSDPTILPADMLTIPGVRRYDTMTGRAAYAVDGPRGHFLVTPARRRGDWEVWRSDELRSRAWCQSAAAGVTTALRMAGAS